MCKYSVITEGKRRVVGNSQPKYENRMRTNFHFKMKSNGPGVKATKKFKAKHIHHHLRFTQIQ